MSGRPVRRRLLAEVERAGGWAAVLARIAGGEPIAGIARSFGVSRSFFARVIHEDRDRHSLVEEARRRATGDARLAEAAELLGGRSRPDARRLRAVLGDRAAGLDRATLGVLDRLHSAVSGERDETTEATVGEAWELAVQRTAPSDVGRLHLDALRAQPIRPPTTLAVTVTAEVREAETSEEPGRA